MNLARIDLETLALFVSVAWLGSISAGTGRRGWRLPTNGENE
jgi:hypothetical protein